MRLAVIGKTFCLIGAACLWPQFAEAANPYLKAEPQIAGWLPPQPLPGDMTDDADLAVYFATRPLAQQGTQTLADAEADDVLSAVQLAQRFAPAVGGSLDDTNSHLLMVLMSRVLDDDGAMLTPLKRFVVDGGRIRPYVRFPQQNACNHVADDTTWHLNTTGSYPSGHTTYGWMWGLILSKIVPEQADTIMARAYGFGQSRLICGFHYPSDLSAGRLAASALFSQLEADKGFRDDLKAAAIQVRQTLKLPPHP